VINERAHHSSRHNEEERFWTLADPAGNEVDIATTSAPAKA
jgi:hypothetical protein